MSNCNVEKLFDTLGVLDSSDSEELRRLTSGRGGRQSTGQVRPSLPDLHMRSSRRAVASTDTARAAIARVVHRAPEAVVKVSSVAKTTGRVWAHLTYITRNGRLTAETDSGQQLTCLDDVRELQQHWSEWCGKRRSNGKLTVNLVLSMPADTNVERFTSAVREFSREAFAGHEYVFALHTPDTDPDPQAPPHPHAHVCVKASSVDGQRLLHGPPQLWEFRQLFAQKLREHGIQAAATPRSIRGVVRKGKRQNMYHMSKNRQDNSCRSNVELAKLRAAANAVLTGKSADGVWEAAAARRHEEVTNTWLELADALRASGKPGDALLSNDIRRFVSSVPAPMTERQDTASRMRKTREGHDPRSDERPKVASAAGTRVQKSRPSVIPTRDSAARKDDHER